MLDQGTTIGRSGGHTVGPPPPSAASMRRADNLAGAARQSTAQARTVPVGPPRADRQLGLRAVRGLMWRER